MKVLSLAAWGTVPMVFEKTDTTPQTILHQHVESGIGIELDDETMEFRIVVGFYNRSEKKPFTRKGTYEYLKERLKQGDQAVIFKGKWVGDPKKYRKELFAEITNNFKNDMLWMMGVSTDEYGAVTIQFEGHNLYKVLNTIKYVRSAIIYRAFSILGVDTDLNFVPIERHDAKPGSRIADILANKDMAVILDKAKGLEPGKTRVCFAKVLESIPNFKKQKANVRITEHQSY